MLLQFRFANFRSFRDEQTLSLIAAPFKDHSETVRHPSGIDEGVLPVAAMYGANASGKTNVLLALEFMRNAVVNSQARWVPDQPIDCKPFVGSSRSPSLFVVDFLLNRTRYQYGFSLSAEAISREWLLAYPRGKKQTWFSRESNKPVRFSAKLQGDNRAIERLTRPNSLYLSAAAQNNHETLTPLYQWFSKSLSFATDERTSLTLPPSSMIEDPSIKNGLAKWLSLADLGISEAVIESKGRSEEKVSFMHRIGDSTLPLAPEQESKGTIAFLLLLNPLLHALNRGNVVAVDELDASLHSLLANEVIRMFNDPKRNSKGAQLIFNTHDSNLLGAGSLRRDQIWFTEKQADGASHLYPLTDFKPRREENIETGYLQGRYGAIPFLNPDRFLASSRRSR
jgi:hypothetical protein